MMFCQYSTFHFCTDIKIDFNGEVLFCFMYNCTFILKHPLHMDLFFSPKIYRICRQKKKKIKFK